MAEHLSSHPLHHPRRVRASATGKSPVRASTSDALRVARQVVLPALAAHGRAGRAVAQKRQWDASAISAMQHLRAEHDGAPVRLRLAGRDVVLLVDPTDVARVLDWAPEPAVVAPTDVRHGMDLVVRHADATGSLDWACFAGGWPRPDATAVVAFRALHLVASYPHEAEPLRAELDQDGPHELDQTRAAVLESGRLWPAEPLLTKRSTEPTTWGDVELPAGTTFVVHTPFFHRDWQTLTYANRFQPRIWLDGEAEENPALRPFGYDLDAATTALAALLEHHTAVPTSAVSMTPDVPATVNHLALSFRLRAR